ncbi:CRISPR-associated protein [Aphanothece hegewaldii CCALA 016]|uniref:CRISPR-associated protein n=1 Tax=Aphanothece hegewaldii CCALA 016 TaxID=2107694 RepID=A0A2T1LYE8_9CHRO|nr:putative CRISPR-associated protein [Aphanothece hegewaldii]PSF37384.1 CRISPR-associated protein [Aphanothece hegewaldii CCALA 016]
MPRLVITTVGTSLLTNQINQRRDPNNWSSRLREMANVTQSTINQHHQDVNDIIQKLKKRAEDKLDNGSTLDIREASAELNGIYGLYDDQLEQGKQDIHWLITTDTAQGQVAAEIVKDFLQKKNFSVDIYQPKNLSTASTQQFTQGIDDLLQWIDEIIRGYKDSGYTICFNLVGGFKALQGYANTIGMFYQAHEMIYIFESNLEVIKIPRLPIQVDKSVIKPVQFAMMAANVGIDINLSELKNVPETLLFIVDKEVTLSNWGRLTWNSCKQEFLTGELLNFPYLIYENSFLNDFKRNNVNSLRKLELQEVLAEVSGSMVKFKGDSTRFSPQLHFTRYEGQQKCEGGLKKNQLDHFYIKNTGWRVSCLTKDNKLHLRHYGEHDYVNNNP